MGILPVKLFLNGELSPILLNNIGEWNDNLDDLFS